MEQTVFLTVLVYPVQVRERGGTERRGRMVLDETRVRAMEQVGIGAEELLGRFYQGRGETLLTLGPAQRHSIPLDAEMLYRVWEEYERGRAATRQEGA